MNFEPQKLFIGLMDFFSILLPGALLIYLLMGDVDLTALMGDKYKTPTGPEGWVVFLITSYLFGHLLFSMGSWLDEVLYDWLRRGYTLNKQIILLARRGQLLPWYARAFIWTVFKQESDLAVDRAGKIKEKMLKGLHAKKAVNTFQWSKVFLAKEHPESLVPVQRFEADSKFFRSFVIVLIVLLVTWPLHHRRLLVAISVLIVPALWRYMEQRYKATNQAYWTVITLVAKSGNVELYNKSNRSLTHAGGVVYRIRGDKVEYLLVEDKDNPEQWVLPKGRIEEGEYPRETAVREVHEEAGVWAKICCNLGTVSYSINGTNTPVQFYLMELLSPGPLRESWRESWSHVLNSKVNREHVWLPLEEVISKATDGDKQVSQSL